MTDTQFFLPSIIKGEFRMQAACDPIDYSERRFHSCNPLVSKTGVRVSVPRVRIFLRQPALTHCRVP